MINDEENILRLIPKMAHAKWGDVTNTRVMSIKVA
jgi:hypothetical protein